MALIAHYPLNGNSDEISGNNKTISASNISWNSVGKTGKQAGTFNGSNTYLRTSTFQRTNGQEISVACWFKQTSRSGYQQLVANRSTSTNYNWLFYFHTNDGSLQFHGTSQYKSNVIPSLNVWHHAVATVDSNQTSRLYLDGQLVQTVTNYSYGPSGSPYIHIGASWPNVESFNGLINDVRIYDHALSQKEAYNLSLGKVAHYTFSDPYALHTINMIEDEANEQGKNTYPTINNEWGTYWTGQYNSNTDFSIGNIVSISNNIITVDGSGRTLYTYDALNPASTGGGVTAGTHYFIKKLSANSFTLHAYNGSQDGSQGYINPSTGEHKVHDSIALDQRVSVSSSGFPTLWHGAPHLPNVALVKEVIPNDYNGETFNGHSFMRMHFDHHAAPQGGMAYGVYIEPGVLSTQNYTFSLWYRAANASSVGKTFYVSQYSGGGWNAGSPTATCTAEWQRLTWTASPPTNQTTGTYIYFWPSSGSTIDISEIQVEKRTYATAFTTHKRAGRINDISGFKNHIPMATINGFGYDIDHTDQYGTWVKIFNHNSEGNTNLFSSDAEAAYTNPEDPNNDKFSILSYISEFVRGDGKYKFKLSYPDTTDNITQIWYQTSDPNSQSISGYSAISIDTTSSGWGGLEPDTGTNTYIDGVPGSSTWWYSIGQRVSYSNNNPGPGVTVNNTTLYICIEETKFDTRFPKPTEDSVVRDGSYYFDGSTHYLNTPLGMSTYFSDGMSFAAWIKPTNTANWSRVIDFGNGASSNNILFARYGTTNNMYLGSYNGTSGGGITATNILTLNTWQHVAFTISNSGAAKIYKNGSAVASGTVNVPNTVTRKNAYIGESNWVNDSFYQGYMNDLRFYVTQLSDSDIAAIYNQRGALDNVGNAFAYKLNERFNRISREGLVLELDPTNPACFSQGDTSAINLVTKGSVNGASGNPGSGTNTASPNNFPSWSPEYGGVFNFAGGKGMNVDEDLGAHSSMSLSMWFYKSGSGTEYFSDARNNGGQWFLANYSGYNITYTNALAYNFGGSYNAANSNFINKWIHMVVTSNSSGSKLYLDGVEVATSSSSSIDEDLGKNFRIGTRYTDSSRWVGYMGPIHIYNRVISDYEIKTLYNTFSDLYGSGNPTFQYVDSKGNANLNIDEFSGTQDTDSEQELSKSGRLFINGQFSEVD